MRKKYLPLFLLIIFLPTCTTMGIMEDDFAELQLANDEGIVVMRIHNDTAGSSLSFYSEKGQELDIPKLRLNSDIEIRKAPFAFSSVIVENNIAPVQLVVTKAKKGLYGIVNVGKNSSFFDPYAFAVQPKAVNYIGEIYLCLIEGNIPMFQKPEDWYELSVVDDFTSIQSEVANIPELSGLPIVNVCTPTKPIRPEFCPID